MKTFSDFLLEKKRQRQGSIKNRVKKGKHKLYKLKDVNTPAEKRSIQSVGGFRGVHGASKKSKAGQGPASSVEYRRKSPASSAKRKPLPKGTIMSIKKAIKEFFGGLLPQELTDPALMREKYGDTWDSEKYRKKRAEAEKELKKNKLIMQHGKKKYRDMVAKGKEAKEKVRDPRGVRFYDKKGKGYLKGGKKTYD